MEIQKQNCCESVYHVCVWGHAGVAIPVEELAKLMGTIRLTRLKHLARTLNKSSSSTGAESSNTGATDAKTRCN